MCRLSLAWVTSENSTSDSNADILSRFSSLNPIFSATGLRSPVLTAPVRGSTPTLFARLSAVQRQLLSSGSPVNCISAVQRHLLSAPLSSQLSFASPYHFRIRRDFRSKNLLSGFAPKQTKESSALAAHPHSAIVWPRIFYTFWDCVISSFGGGGSYRKTFCSQSRWLLDFTVSFYYYYYYLD